MANTLATMLTMTTYGSWLRGDRRGWVENGIIFPPDPDLESADRARMKHPPDATGSASVLPNHHSSRLPDNARTSLYAVVPPEPRPSTPASSSPAARAIIHLEARHVD